MQFFIVFGYLMGKIVVITAPSAAGKTTLIKKYLENHPQTLFSVSHTTRDKRSGEIEGKDYYFIDKEKFEEMINEGKFLEWANVHEHYYGTSFEEIEKAKNKNDTLILDLDIQGALFLKENGIKAKYIFIEPVSIEDLKNRLQGRGTESEEDIKIRIWDAKRELEYKDRFDFIIKNEEIEDAYKELEKAINSKK